MRFEDLLDRRGPSGIGWETGAERLEISGATSAPGRARRHDAEFPGWSRRRPGSSAVCADPLEIGRMLDLYRERYMGLTLKHFHERMVWRHGCMLTYAQTKTHLRHAGLALAVTKRSAHVKKRPRQPRVGLLLRQDAARHAWLPTCAGAHDLVITLDDATSEILSALLVDGAGTASSFRSLAEVIERRGLFGALHTDRGGHYFHPPQEGAKAAGTAPTQVGRALRQLGIQHVPAHSPQAQDRTGRAFLTLRERLPAELALAGIATVEAANRWLARTYIDQYNATFAVPAEQEGSGFIADAAGVAREILCVQEHRPVGPGYTVAWRALRLRLPPSRLRPRAARVGVRLHEYPGGRLALFLGTHRLADYDAGGVLVDAIQIAA